MRRVFATTLKTKGADLDDIKEYLGHKSLDMTMRYAHITSDRKKRVIRLLDGHELGTCREQAAPPENQGQAEVAELKEKTNTCAGSSVG